MLFVLFFAACSSSAPDVGEMMEIIGDAPEVEDALPEDRNWLYQPTVIHDFFIELSDEARASLTIDPSADVPATFTSDGHSWTVALHLRGNKTLRTLDGKPSLKIDFHEYNAEQTFGGSRRLTLNNMVQDGSMLRDEAAYYLFRAVGVPAPRHGYARVWINDLSYGLYGIVETIDEQFLADHFVSNDGNAYSGGYGADLNPGCAALFELKESGGDAIPPYEDLTALINAVADEDDVTDVVDGWFDESLLRMFAVEAVIGQRDGYVGYANNYVLYFDPDVAKWSMMPWGPDQAFLSGRRELFDDWWFGTLAVHCTWDGDCRDRVTSYAEEVLTVWESVDLLGHISTVQRVIATDCEADPRRELPCAPDQLNLLEYIAERPEDMWAELE